MHITIGTGASAAWTRLGGNTRYDTMSDILDEAYPDGSCSAVIVVSGDNYPDALTASSFLKIPCDDCAIVLTSSKTLSEQAHDQIVRLGAKQAIIIGGPDAISTQVESQLKAIVGDESVERIYGADRVSTALAIYAAGTNAREDEYCWSHKVIITTGFNYADALSISSYAASSWTPIMLTQADGTLDADTIATIEGKINNNKNDGERITRALIIGGPNAVSTKVESQLEGAGIASESIERIQGANRYETSAAIVNIPLPIQICI